MKGKEGRKREEREGEEEGRRKGEKGGEDKFFHTDIHVTFILLYKSGVPWHSGLSLKHFI